MEKKFFDQPLKNYLITSENFQKIAAGHVDDYTTGCLLDYNYFKNYYNMIAIDLSKQQGLVNKTTLNVKLSNSNLIN